MTNYVSNRKDDESKTKRLIISTHAKQTNHIPEAFLCAVTVRALLKPQPWIDKIGRS